MTGRKLTLQEELTRLEVLKRFGHITEAQFSGRKAALEAQFANAPTGETSSTSSNRPQQDRSGRPTLVRQERPEYYRAPYRFVPYDSEAVLLAEDAAKQRMDKPKPEGLCASIELEWEAESPLLIGKKGNDGIVKAVTRNGAYFIPAATLRGAVRSVAEIIGAARLTQVNDTASFGLRDFTHAAYANAEAVEGDGNYPIANPSMLKAGWLRLVGEPDANDKGLLKASVEICDIGFDWYPVEVSALIEKGYVNTRGDAKEFTKLEAINKYQSADLVRNGAITTVSAPKLFALSAPLYGKQRAEPRANGGVRACLVFSGKSPSGKKIEYAFKPPQTNGDWRKLDSNIWERFVRIHGQSVDTRVDPVGSWKPYAEMLQRSPQTIIPIFYVGNLADQNPKRFAFGLTRLFKVPHRHTLQDVLAKSGAGPQVEVREGPAGRQVAFKENSDVDMVEQLFGYVYESNEPKAEQQSGRTSQAPKDLARKGRIAFSSATLVDGANAKEGDTIATVMSGPRASFAPFYLEGDSKDYSADVTPKISGRKRYPVRFTGETMASATNSVKAQLDKQIEAIRRMNPRGDGPNESVTTRLRFLVPAGNQPLRFRSEVRLFDVTAAELGLALQTLSMEGDKDCRWSLGRAKPFGAGQMKLTIKAIHVEKNISEGALPEGHLSREAAAPYVECFKAYASERLGSSGSASRSTSVSVLRAIATPATWAEPFKKGRLDYLRLREPLPNGRDENPYVRLRDTTKPAKDGSRPAGGRRLLKIGS